jgi:hypothetical protein
MAADARDDFSMLAGSEHMFFGIADPAAMVRDQYETGLRRQVADTVVERIRVVDQPKFLTIARKTDDASNVIVTFFGVCIRADLEVSFAGGREQLPTTITLLFGRWDEAGKSTSRTHVDVHADALRMFDDAAFKDRFLAWRMEHEEPES